MADETAKQLKDLIKKDDPIFLVSPLYRTMETIMPLLTELYGADVVSNIEKKYFEAQKIYQDLRDKKEIQDYLKDQNKQKLFQLYDNVYMDFRQTDVIIPEWQDKELIP